MRRYALYRVPVLVFLCNIHCCVFALQKYSVGAIYFILTFIFSFIVK